MSKENKICFFRRQNTWLKVEKMSSWMSEVSNPTSLQSNVFLSLPFKMTKTQVRIVKTNMNKISWWFIIANYGNYVFPIVLLQPKVKGIIFPPQFWNILNRIKFTSYYVKTFFISFHFPNSNVIEAKIRRKDGLNFHSFSLLASTVHSLQTHL